MHSEIVPWQLQNTCKTALDSYHARIYQEDGPILEMRTKHHFCRITTLLTFLKNRYPGLKLGNKLKKFIPPGVFHQI